MFSNKHLRRALVTVLGGAAASLVMGVAPAHAVSIVESDHVSLSTANGSTRATIAWLYDTNTHNLRGQVFGTVTRPSGADTACVFVIADWFYADGTHLQTLAPYSASSSGTRARACNDGFVNSETGTNTRSFSQASDPNKDVVRVNVYLRNSADPTTGGTTVKMKTELVGDAPDSLGTNAQLDVDAVPIAVGGQGLLTDGSGSFRAAAKYSLTPGSAGQFDLRATVTGVLQFSDVIRGTKVHAAVIYHTSSGDVIGGRYDAARGATAVAINETSPSGKDTRSVTINLFDDQGNFLASSTSELDSI
jgi:hypothetical protein